MRDELLSIKNLNKEFSLSKRLFNNKEYAFKAVDNVSFNLYRGDVLGIIGESGSGKTTLMRIIIGLESKTSGSIIYKGESIGHIRKKSFKRDVQMIFQDSYASLNPRMKVKEILAEPFRVHFKMADIKIKEESLKLLEQVGISQNSMVKFPHELSGGQRQRINIARALATKPKLIICDEPTSSLDVSTQAQVLNLLKDLQETNDISYIFVSHNMSVIKFISQEVIVMNRGKIVEHQNKVELFNNPREEYTKQLIEAVPIPNPNNLQFKVV